MPISTSMNILAATVFGRVETGFLVNIESKWVDNLPVSTEWLKNTSKLFQKAAKLKKPGFYLVNIQA